MSGCTHICNQGRDCTCSTPAQDCAAKVTRVKACKQGSDAGNFRLNQLDYIEPCSGAEMALVWGLALVMGLCSTAVIVTGAIYLFQQIFN
jgi:hypothetical protein